MIYKIILNLIVEGKMEQIADRGLPVESSMEYTLIHSSKIRVFSSILTFTCQLNVEPIELFLYRLY